jgi:Protein of unknown function (DUF2934)
MTNEHDELEQRIRERAYTIWLDEGCPDGRDKEHWEVAKLAIADEDGQAVTLLAPEAPQPEPTEAIENQGEFPTLVDQGEGQNSSSRQHSTRKQLGR